MDLTNIPEKMLRPDYAFQARDFADPECPNCSGTGMYDLSRDGQPFDWRECPCVSAGRSLIYTEVLLRRAFSVQQRAMTFHTWQTGDEAKNEQALKIARRFVEHWDKAVNESWILGFFGDMNCGKTHLVIAIAQAVAKAKAVQPYFVNVPELLERQRETFGTRDAVDPTLRPLRMAQNADLLVLDDIGAEYNKGADENAVTWAEDFLYKVLDFRINNNRPTLYTTNLKKSQMKQLGARVQSRIERKQILPPREIIKVPGTGQISEESRRLLLG
jgi:DNA replication protein DnaC